MNPRGARTAPAAAAPGVDLYWLPLGSGDGGRCVRGSGRLFELVTSLRRHRAPVELYHSALVVHLDGAAFTIEMTPVWTSTRPDRGVVGEGPVGLRVLGRSRLFRYEVRCWRGGIIPDLAAAVESPRRVSADRLVAEEVVRLVPLVPLVTWGLDEQHTGEMWNSNSLTSWLLAGSGHDSGATALQPPAHGRAPGWSAGLVVAGRDAGCSRAARADGRDLTFQPVPGRRSPAFRDGIGTKDVVEGKKGTIM